MSETNTIPPPLPKREPPPLPKREPPPLPSRTEDWILNLAHKLFKLGKRYFNAAEETPIMPIIDWFERDWHQKVGVIGIIGVAIVWILNKTGVSIPFAMPDRFIDRVKFFGGIVVCLIAIVALALFIPGLLVYLVGGVIWILGVVVRVIRVVRAFWK